MKKQPKTVRLSVKVLNAIEKEGKFSESASDVLERLLLEHFRYRQLFSRLGETTQYKKDMGKEDPEYDEGDGLDDN